MIGSPRSRALRAAIALALGLAGCLGEPGTVGIDPGATPCRDAAVDGETDCEEDLTCTTSADCPPDRPTCSSDGECQS